ncbi:general transcription factor IIE subunit, partial [Trifolium pratense]
MISSDITSGMNLTKEQRGGEDEYIKAYYAALLKKQHELEEAAKNPQDANAADDPSSSTSIRKVGDKYKREEDDDDDGTEWEEAPARGNGGAYKVDLNVEADAPAEDDEEDINWEE